MKVFFLLGYPGYTRYFDEVIRRLVERGHSVEVAFDTNAKQPEGQEALRGRGDALSVHDEDLPHRNDSWRNYVHSLRGVVDYVRYLDPVFADSPYLRERMGKALPPGFAFLTSAPTLPGPVARTLRRFFGALEQLAPPADNLTDILKASSPDVVLVSPLVTNRSWQTDVVKAAMGLGIPTGVCVASWDHLTSKGMIRIVPDRVFLWNPVQRDEAIALHDIPSERIVVTGAQPFDKWFRREPTVSADFFCRQVGFDSERPYILFVGSTASISNPAAELAFVESWIEALRAHPDPLVRKSAILIRPHPFNWEHWLDGTPERHKQVAIYPRYGANPVDPVHRADYFHSLYFSSAVVGINTSAMVEAAIVGRPVFSILSDRFKDTQGGTVHFRYLLPQHGGFVKTAESLAEHADQISDVLVSQKYKKPLRDFVGRFVRPLGRKHEATATLVDGIEGLAALGVRPGRQVPAAVLPVAALVERWLPVPRSRRARDGGLEGDAAVLPPDANALVDVLFGTVAGLTGGLRPTFEATAPWGDGGVALSGVAFIGGDGTAIRMGELRCAGPAWPGGTAAPMPPSLRLEVVDLELPIAVSPALGWLTALLGETVRLSLTLDYNHTAPRFELRELSVGLQGATLALTAKLDGFVLGDDGDVFVALGGAILRSLDLTLDDGGFLDRLLAFVAASAVAVASPIVNGAMIRIYGASEGTKAKARPQALAMRSYLKGRRRDAATPESRRFFAGLLEVATDLPSLRGPVTLRVAPNTPLPVADAILALMRDPELLIARAGATLRMAEPTRARRTA